MSGHDVGIAGHDVGMGRGCVAKTFNKRVRAHTFVDHGAGQWGVAHDDVTPMVGLALMAINADSALVRKVRSAVLRSRIRSGVWHSYWWASDAYATVQSLEFLEVSGGIPADVMADARAWLVDISTQSVLETALVVEICRCLDCRDLARPLVELLLDSQGSNGEWPQSHLLLVPDAALDSTSAPVAYPDCLGLMSTAAAVRSLKRWSNQTDSIRVWQGQPGHPVRSNAINRAHLDQTLADF